MNHKEFYSAIDKYINSQHNEFKTLTENSNEISDNDYIMTLIYKMRIRKMVSEIIFNEKPNDMSWKAFYDLIYFLHKNKDASWLVNSLAKNGKLFELDLLSYMKNIVLTQHDIDTAARNNQIAFLKEIYRLSGNLPDFNILFEKELPSPALDQFFSDINYAPKRKDFINAFSAEPLNAYILEFYKTKTYINTALESLDYALENNKVKLYHNLLSLFAFNGATIFRLIEKAIDKQNLPICMLLINDILRNIDKNDFISIDKVVAALINAAQRYGAPLLIYILKEGYKISFNDTLAKIIIDNNLYQILDILQERGLTSTYIRRNRVNILKLRNLSDEMKILIRQYY